MTFDDILVVVRELCAMWGRIDQREVKRSDAPRARAAMAFAANAIDHATGAITLWNKNIYHASIPLVRICFESALFAAWAEQESNQVVDVLIAENARQGKNLAAQLQKAGMPLSPELQTGIETLAASPTVDVPGSARKIEELCKYFNNSDILYLAYRILSGESHAPSALRRFLNEGDEDNGIAMGPDLNSTAQELMAHLVASSLLWAVRACDELDVGRPFSRDLDRLATVLHVEPQLVRK